MNNIFLIKDLNFNFNGLTLFKNISFEIPKNSVTVIMGLNGCGKTTLLKIIAGIINIKGTDKINNSKKVFYLPQNIKYPYELTLFDYLSAVYFKDNLKWFLRQSEKETINNLLKEFNLYDKKELQINKLSSGELQKANICLAILSDADFLLLDEPTSNMDLINQIKTINTIKDLSEKITSLVVVHDINMAYKLGEYFIGISENGIIKGTKQEFFTSENLKKIFKLDFKLTNKDGKFYAQTCD